jgi:hypothetical protein
VEDIPETDKWECRWCGRIRHFNSERKAATEMVGMAAALNERSPRSRLQSALVDKQAYTGERFHLDVDPGSDSPVSSS